MIEVDVVVGQEVWVECHPEESIFLLIGDDEFPQRDYLICRGVNALNFPRDFDEVDHAIRSVFEMHWLGNAGVQGFDLEAMGRGRLREGRGGNGEE